MTQICTCRHLAGVLESIFARSVHEAEVRVLNAPEVLVRFTAGPPTIRRWITVQPVGGAEYCRRRF